MDNADNESILPITEWPVVTSASRSDEERKSDTIQTISSFTTKYGEQKFGRQQKVINSQIQAHFQEKSLFAKPSTSTFTEPLCKKQKIYPSTSSSSSKRLIFELQSQDEPCSKDIDIFGSKTEEIFFSNTSTGESNQTFKEHEPLAQVRVARWWRRHKHLHQQPVPVTNNPNTMLFHISRTKDCISYLSEEKRKLQKKLSQIHFKDRADIHAAIASIDDWLGNYKTALHSISHAVDLEPTTSKYRWLKAKLQKQCTVINVQKVQMKLINTVPKMFPAMLEVERVSAMDLGKDEFMKRFVYRRQPVILLDVVKDMTASTWDLEFVSSVAGPVMASLKHAIPFSVEWAKLEQSKEMTVGEFINQVKKGQTSDYLFDWSIPIHCPQLARDIIIPKYFSENFLQKTSPGTLYHDSWPSLFIAPKGTVSSLHVDAFASHFWMALFQGEKRWIFFDADDTPLLYPQYVHSMDPVFSVDLLLPDAEHWPLLALTRPRQCVLQPGELLFVPAGSPHYVQNLSNSLAISSNHVDQSNYEQVCKELRINSLLDPRAADLLQQLDHPEFVQAVLRSNHDLVKLETP